MKPGKEQRQTSNNIKIPMYGDEVERIRQENIKLLRKVLERRLGKDNGKLLCDAIIGEK